MLGLAGVAAGPFGLYAQQVSGTEAKLGFSKFLKGLSILILKVFAAFILFV